jgi:hypothetical protein
LVAGATWDGLDPAALRGGSPAAAAVLRGWGVGS